MDSEQIAAAAKLVSQIGLLRDSIIWAVLALGAIGSITFVIWNWIAYKKHRSTEQAKDARSKQNADAMQAQAVAMRGMTGTLATLNASQAGSLKRIDAISTNMSSEMRDMRGIIGQVDALVKRVLDKQEGVASLPTSVMIVQTYFYKVLFSDSVLIIHKSLHENDFKNRAPFITNKVKTDIGKVMSSIKAELSELDLSFDASTFFKTEFESSDRFVLVNMIWDSIKGLYLTEQSLYDKWEEASYKIMNTIKDHFASIRHEAIEGTTTYAKYDRNKFKTPLSLRPPQS